jgi:predicted  nucleic acid-binding Zn-ribbon protein
MLDEFEQERDNAREYAKKLETDLAKTKEVLKNNQLNLIEPLQSKIIELEKMVEEKEADIKKRYKWKLRKYKREIEMERKINQKLKSKLSRSNSRVKKEGS